MDDAAASPVLDCVRFPKSVASPRVAMVMYSIMASGSDFEEAFQITYDISWKDAKPLFAEYVSAVISNLFTSY